MITGTRRIGKTYLIRRFLEEKADDDKYVEFNLSEMRQLWAIFNLSRLFSFLQAFRHMLP